MTLSDLCEWQVSVILLLINSSLKIFVKNTAKIMHSKFVTNSFRNIIVPLVLYVNIWYFVETSSYNIAG